MLLSSAGIPLLLRASALLQTPAPLGDLHFIYKQYIQFCFLFCHSLKHVDIFISTHHKLLLSSNIFSSWFSHSSLVLQCPFKLLPQSKLRHERAFVELLVQPSPLAIYNKHNQTSQWNYKHSVHGVCCLFSASKPNRNRYFSKTATALMPLLLLRRDTVARINFMGFLRIITSLVEPLRFQEYLCTNCQISHIKLSSRVWRAQLQANVVHQRLCLSLRCKTGNWGILS